MPHAQVHHRRREARPWTTPKVMAAPLGHVVLLSIPIVIFSIRVKLTEYKIKPLKVIKSMALSAFTVVHNYHLYLVPNISITPK